MTRPDREELSHEERQWVENLRDQYAPPARTPAQRVALNDALATRIRRRRIPLWQPVAAAACSAALVIWFLVSGGPGGGTSQIAQADRGEVLIGLAFGNEEVAYAGDILPDDYAILAEVFDL